MAHRSDKSVLIIGGGVAGMSAAKLLGAQGVDIHLVEKNDHLGGRSFDWACMATDKCEYCGACLSQELVEQVKMLENGTIYTECRIHSIDKFDGGYHVSIKGVSEAEFDVHAIVIASGFEPFDPGHLEFFEYDKKGVVTTAELNAILKKEDLINSLNGNDAPSIAFIQCVGSRNREIGLDYCSQVCCRTAVRHAGKILHLIPGASITIFHMDLQVCGKMFRTQIDQLGERVNLVQGTPGKVLSLDNDRIRLIQEDPSTGERKPFDFDMVVLAVGMRPGNDNSEIAAMLDLNSDKWGFINDYNASSDKKVYSIGSVTGPVDILTSIEQGVSAAHRILYDLEIAKPDLNKEIAVIGRGDEGTLISKTLTDEGHTVHLFDSGSDAGEYDGQTIYNDVQITGISGTWGSYTVSARSKDEEIEARVSAIIVASGSSKKQISDENKLPQNDRIISLGKFEKDLKDNLNGDCQNIIFWLDHAGYEWKENSRKVLDSAIEMAETGKSVAVIMERMLVNGIHGQEIYDSARSKSVKFLRVASPSDVRVQEDNGKFKVTINEATLAGIELKIPCDLMVIPEEVVPNPDNPELAGILKQAIDDEGYHQHPNPRHRRVMSTRRGIFYAGSCHDETDKHDLEHETRTIKALINLTPFGNTEENIFAEIDKGKCVKCLTCFRVCPHGSIILDGYQPRIIENACYACGLCVSFCPGSAISIKGQTAPVESKNRTQSTVIFACKRSAALAEKSISFNDSNNRPDYRIIPVDCACSLDSKEVINQFVEGAEKIMVITCHNENCLSMNGSTSARLKIEKIYADTGVSQSMLSLHSVAANEPAKLKELINRAKHSQKESSDE